jgi:hypothetical protein
MITGDSKPVADSVARRICIDEVAAEVLPTDKASAVKRFQCRRGPPISMILPFTRALAPRPGSASNSAACRVGRFRRLASATIALASGCSELASTAAARAIVAARRSRDCR